MLSRAANVPRACFANRLSLSILSPRSTPNIRILHGREEWIQRRCYSSDPVIHSKEKIEALISGRISQRDFERSTKKASKRPPKKSSSRKPWRRRKEEEIPDWGLAAFPTEADSTIQGKAAQQLEEEIKHDLPEELVEKLAGKLTEELAKELDTEELAVDELPAEELDADKLNQLEHAAPQDGAVIAEADALKPSQARPNRAPKKDFYDELVQSRSVRVAALGEHIDAIMLKNPNEMKKPKRPVRRIQEEESTAAVELDSERKNMVNEKDEDDEETMKAALKNIEDLKPKDKSILRMQDFDVLANTLLEGFTFNQLAKFFNQERLKRSSRAQGKPPSYPWIVNQGPWVAAKPDHWGPLRPKQRQVIMIMQTIWNLEVQEQVEGLGRTLVWLQPRIFELIAPPNSGVLEQLSRDFLYQSNKEKITTSLDDHRINIYARKSTIPVILAHLHENVKSIRRQKISSDHIQEQDLDEKLLRELERITKTHIAYNKDNRELDISWLQNNNPATTGADSKNTETPADIALRLLLEQTNKDYQSNVHIVSSSDASALKNEGVFVSHLRESRSMSWKDKLSQWSRYVTPVGQTATLGDGVSAQFPHVVSDIKENTETETAHQVTASFGHVLHGKNSRTVAAMAKHRRLLSPVLPHPASFTSLMKEDKPIAQRTTVVFNFFPDPKLSPTKYDSIPPTMQLQLPINPGTDFATFPLAPGSGLFGVAAQHVDDVLFPGESVDVRLTQNYILPFGESQEPIKEFLSQSEFDLPQGILKTPSKIKFSIPKAWVTKAKTTRKPSSTTVNVPYIFMGLEIHQTVQLEFHGHTLCYSSIDAGRHGGDRQELSLQAGLPQSKDAEPFALDEDEASQFLSLVEGVAAGKYFSWHNGSQLMRETPDVSTLKEESTEDHSSLPEAEDHELDQSNESEPLQNTEQQDSHSSPETSIDINTDGQPSEDSQSHSPDEQKET